MRNLKELQDKRTELIKVIIKGSHYNIKSLKVAVNYLTWVLDDNGTTYLATPEKNIPEVKEVEKIIVEKGDVNVNVNIDKDSVKEFMKTINEAENKSETRHKELMKILNKILSEL